MKALTVCQPYAHLIALDEKPVENRTWATTYRGPLAIHAGMSRAWLEGPEGNLVFGAVVAVATLSEVLAHAKLPPDLRDHRHSLGPVCWVLTNVKRLPRPVPCRGAQGLWNLPTDVYGDVRAQLEAGA